MFSTNTCTCNDNYVYLNKIFFNENENASPIMTTFETSATNFTQQITVGTNICGCNECHDSCGCNCNCCCDVTITADTIFNITNSYVIVHSFSLTDQTALTTGDVTVEGIPITTLTPNGNQFIGEINGIMSRITKCACKQPCANSCPGNYVMISAPGTWDLVATIVIEGTINSAGSSCQFRICYNTEAEAPIVVSGPASFAFCNVEIPCQVSGVSPTLVFDFSSCVKLLNPVISVICADGVCTPVLSGSLVVTPQINLQILRPSLFNLGNCEVEIPCDDMGQCNPCNQAEAKCINPNIACQCCDTNGFGF